MGGGGVYNIEGMDGWEKKSGKGKKKEGRGDSKNDGREGMQPKKGKKIRQQVEGIRGE